MLEKSWDLDPTGLTTLMIVRGYFEEYLKDLKFDAMDMILNRARIASTLVPLEALRDLLEGEMVQELVGDFQKGLTDRAVAYGAEITETFEKLHKYCYFPNMGGSKKSR